LQGPGEVRGRADKLINKHCGRIGHGLAPSVEPVIFPQSVAVVEVSYA
jgi:hypothetical protein